MQWKSIGFLGLCLVLVSCGDNKLVCCKPTVEVDLVVESGRTFCQDGALYQVPEWDETGKNGFIVEGRQC